MIRNWAYTFGAMLVFDVFGGGFLVSDALPFSGHDKTLSLAEFRNQELSNDSSYICFREKMDDDILCVRLIGFSPKKSLASVDTIYPTTVWDNCAGYHLAMLVLNRKCVSIECGDQSTLRFRDSTIVFSDSPYESFMADTLRISQEAGFCGVR